MLYSGFTFKEFCDCIVRCGQPTGIKVAQPMMISLKTDSTHEYVNILRQVINPHVQMVVCFCPTNRDDRYAAIKKICCVDHPIPSQVLLYYGFILTNRGHYLVGLTISM